jgi:hypothetical protein
MLQQLPVAAVSAQRTCPVAFIAHVSNAVKHLGLHQLSNALHQVSLLYHDR